MLIIYQVLFKLSANFSNSGFFFSMVWLAKTEISTGIHQYVRRVIIFYTWLFGFSSNISVKLALDMFVFIMWIGGCPSNSDGSGRLGKFVVNIRTISFFFLF